MKGPILLLLAPPNHRPPLREALQSMWQSWVDSAQDFLLNDLRHLITDLAADRQVEENHHPHQAVAAQHSPPSRRRFGRRGQLEGERRQRKVYPWTRLDECLYRRGCRSARDDAVPSLCPRHHLAIRQVHC